MIHRFLRPKVDSRSETIWLTIYADLITNLVLVFLALFGLTVMGDDALTRAIQSMKLGDIKPITETPKTLDELGPALLDQLQDQQDILISEESGAVRIQFGEEVLFDSGHATLKKTSLQALATVAKNLGELPYTIIVEGHSDPIPLQKGARYRDNWELSLARAMAVVRALHESAGIPEDRLAAAAYGPYKPLASNETEAGRKRNRRVEIALFKDFKYGR